MDDFYDPAAVEREAQAFWETQGTFRAVEDPSREKFYCLSMFPYPSGKLHMGHVRNYTIGDVIARHQRMRGKNVLQPMGWDAFGLPAENAAIANRIPPARWTYANIEQMRGQLQRLGFGYDWSREIATCRPGYYRWEQWFFLKLLERGLVYRRKAQVNWDPVDHTVLANEQVIDGRGWRSGALVERREIEQWFLKITDYAPELLADLDRLDGWPDAVRTMQRNWIGRSTGVEADFAIAGQEAPIRIFTTRPDTIMGVTYLAVAPEHPLARAAARRDADVAAFVEECARAGTSEAVIEALEKRGVPLGLEAIHPLTGARVPVWTANFVLMSYGTGAVMAVPAHDERDHAFALKHGLPIRPVVFPVDGSTPDMSQVAHTAPGVLRDSGVFDGLTSAQACAAIADALEAAGRGARRVQWRLRDWGISRQRYWGCPIPVIHCPACGVVPVPERDLPVVLPEDVAFEGVTSPLQRMAEFLDVACPACGAAARRETDTFDTFFESSWYYARYCCADQTDAMLDERVRYWLPVDQYIGGIEHAVLHLLYARFFHKCLRDVGLVSGEEPFTRLLTQGMVVAETYHREEGGRPRWFNHREVAVERDGKGRIVAARLLADGEPVTVGNIEKMSKSKNNGVDPQEMIDRYGADTVRLFMMFAAPPEQSLEWSESGVEGAFRFLKRLWKLVATHVDAGVVADAPDVRVLSDDGRGLYRKLHETLARAGEDIGRRHTFNTAIAAVMELMNGLSRHEEDGENARALRQVVCEAIVLLLAPIVPHVAHVLWHRLGHAGPVVDARWPEADPAALVRDQLDLAVQVNGKLRGQIRVSADAAREIIEQAALGDPVVLRHLEGRPVKKVIVVPGRLVNLVV